MPQKLNEFREVANGERATVLKEVQDMILYYRESTNPECPATGEADALSCWLSVKEIFALIAENPGMNGIRIYYGRHRGSTLSKDLPREYQDRHNIILVPTSDKVNPANPSVENSNDMLNADETRDFVNSVSYSGKGADGAPPSPPASTGDHL